MNRSTSLYCDTLRLGAALTVFLAHGTYEKFGGIGRVGESAHVAVIVFFVLSGYVITYVATERERSLPEFTASRMARIYSVAFPALALTAAIDLMMLAAGNPLGIQTYQLSQPLKYLPVFLTFTTDIWFLNENAFSDAPYWSLCYEVWYYIVFAVLFYLRGASRVILATIALAIMGPRLWLLWPVWLMGAGVYMAKRRLSVSRSTAWLIFGLSVFGFLAVRHLGIDDTLNDAFNAMTRGWAEARLRYSQDLPGDLLMGALVSASIFAAGHIDVPLGWLARPITLGAGLSFTLYLMHYPLLEFLFVRFGLEGAPLMLAALILVVLLAFITEKNKGPLRRLLLRAYDILMANLRRA